MSSLFSVPQECLVYTKVFTTLKLEIGIAILVGIWFGYYLGRK